MTPSAIVAFLGGIGLFLLGMKLMTDGLRVAAGPALRRVLLAATRSRVRGLASGVLITAVVQSSSAVIFATIGFVNAGLLTLGQSVGVIFGANLGTTLTSWVVSLVGFNVNLQALALPMVALGMGLRIVVRMGRVGALGEALAGLGLFFLGIEVLRDTFGGLGPEIIPDIAGGGYLQLPVFLLAGFVLTVLMQSSSAALAVTLTAAAGGLVSLEAAAGMVIGANMGTTSTAAFAALGATAAARRTALAHVLFNVVTAAAALLLFPLLLGGMAWMIADSGSPSAVATALAAFHTATKLIGVIVVWPLTPRLVRFLEARFTGRERTPGQPRYLDRNVLAAPVLAVSALALELDRLRDMTDRLLRIALSGDNADPVRLQTDRDHAEELALAIGEFCRELGQGSGDPSLSDVLPAALRVIQYRLDVADRALELQRLWAAEDMSHAVHRDETRGLLIRATAFFAAQPVALERGDVAAAEERRQEFDAAYRELKARLLQAGTDGRVSMRQLVVLLDILSAVRRAVDQAVKALHYRQKVLDSLPSSDGVEEAGTVLP